MHFNHCHGSQTTYLFSAAIERTVDFDADFTDCHSPLFNKASKWAGNGISEIEKLVINSRADISVECLTILRPYKYSYDMKRSHQEHVNNSNACEESNMSLI